jgi:hypothetical protein
MLEGLVHDLLNSQTESHLEDLDYSGSLNVGSGRGCADTPGSGIPSLGGAIQPAGSQYDGFNYQRTSQGHHISPNNVAPRRAIILTCCKFT